MHAVDDDENDVANEGNTWNRRMEARSGSEGRQTVEEDLKSRNSRGM